MAQARAKVRSFPVIEIFGPTIQGEGPEAGLPCSFIRFGGCDFRCSWCDSMHAVEPALVRRNAEKLSARQIVGRLKALEGDPWWIVLSGGNPALHELGGLVAEIQETGRLVSVETQGSLWKDWLADVDRLVISPKPPSSGMASVQNQSAFAGFMDALAEHDQGGAAVLKIPIFDALDLKWARALRKGYSKLPLYLSVGTPVDELEGADEDEHRRIVGDRYRWLCEAALEDQAFASTRILPQLHVIAWGGALGV